MLEGGQCAEERLQHSDGEVCEDDGGVLCSAKQAAAHQQLGLARLEAQLLQFNALYAVTAPIGHHLTKQPLSCRQQSQNKV